MRAIVNGRWLLGFVACLAATLGSRPCAAEVAPHYAELPVGRVFYLDSGGEGDVVVFLHARSGNSLLFERQIEPFTKAGYRFIAFDRVGQGRSTRASDAPSADARPELEQLMDHLAIARAHLVGVAAGGGVVLEYVIAHPQRVASITIANSVGNVQDPDYLALGRRLRPPEFDRLPLELRELGPSYRAANVEGVRRWLELSTSGQQSPAPQTVGAVPVTFAALAELDVPTLLLTGDADLYTPPAVLRLFNEHMPRAELVIVPDSGHAANWENPEAFNRAVLRFLRKRR
ncbi:MAG TPA: alpha/beta hydrolase [Gammaproteobacteria bacterium]|nr:alpha/beta hydrolase [Gammaproteobacteria bacterium]